MLLRGSTLTLWRRVAKVIALIRLNNAQ